MGSAVYPEIVRDALDGYLRSDGLICSLPPRAVLFMEGEPARGVHIISKGHLKLTANSCEGRSLILQIAEPGDILGLHNCITGAAYEMTAQALQPICVSFVNRKDLLRILHQHPEACLSAAEQLGRTCHRTYREISSWKLAYSTKVRLARFLLSLSDEASGSEGDCRRGARVELHLTHEEVAQAIGSSRETVTRVFADFRKKQLASLRRSVLVVQNPQELERIAGRGSTSRELGTLMPDPGKHGAVSFTGIRSFAAQRSTLLKNGTRP
jgi:CRP/FNR family transcriptional regulator, cyclic AMP receptor protein